MSEKYKYRIIKGEQTPLADIVHEHGFELLLPGLIVEFGGIEYRVVDFPTRTGVAAVWIAEIEQV